MVNRYEAMRRLRAKEPVVKRDHGEKGRFVFSIAPGELIEIDEDNGGRGLYRIRSISQDKRGRILFEFVDIKDSRIKKDIKSDKAWNSKLIEPLRKVNCRKVTITPLGEVRRAND